jgi:putative endonuclease
MYYVYVLRSEKDKKRYIGVTENIDRRLYDHYNGLVKSTKHRRPLKLVHKEEFRSKIEALKRERFFKSGQGREYLKEVLDK